MKRRLFFTLATTIFILGGPTTLGGVPCLVPDCFCPQSSSGWMLFEDSNRDAPDFWWRDSLEVQEVKVCSHGITFLFLAEEEETLYLVALMFAHPSGAVPEMCEGLARAARLPRCFYESRDVGRTLNGSP